MAEERQQGRREGFVVLYKGILSQGDNAWFQGRWLAACVYASLLSDANWRDGLAPLPRQKVALKAGELLLTGGERGWAKARGISRQKLRSALAYLEHNRKISPRTSPHGTIITILNYKRDYLEWLRGQPTDSPPPAHHQPYQDTMTAEQEDISGTASDADADRESWDEPGEEGGDLTPAQFDHEAAAHLQRQIIKTNRDAVRAKRASLPSWANVFRLMREKDKIQQDRILEILNFTFGDRHWKTRIKCAASFRSHWDDITADANNPRKGREGGYRRGGFTRDGF